MNQRCVFCRIIMDSDISSTEKFTKKNHGHQDNYEDNNLKIRWRFRRARIEIPLSPCSSDVECGVYHRCLQSRCIWSLIRGSLVHFIIRFFINFIKHLIYFIMFILNLMIIIIIIAIDIIQTVIQIQSQY